MDMKKLLEAVNKFAGGPDQKTGPAGQLRGGEPMPKLGSKKHPAYHKLVGGSEQQEESLLKDLSKGPTPKTKEQELAEEFQAFLEAEFKDTVDRRPARKSDRPSRGHEPQPRYKTIKNEESLSDIDIELQDYRSMTNQEFQTAYGISKMDWINKNKALVIQNPDIKRALGLKEDSGQQYTVIVDRKGRERPVTGTIPELLDYFGYTLEVGKSYEHERGRYKINMNPKNIQSLVDNLNKAASNGAANGAPSTYYSVGESQVAEGVPYKATNPHPASKDPIVAKVLKQMRPGLTGLEMNNEAFLYFAYEIGKMRAREMWEDYGPAIKHFYQSGIGVNELDEAYGMGPKPYKGWTYDVWEDDDGDVRKKFHSAKKAGQEVDMDWSPYDTPQDKDWQLWIDLGMPTREQLGLRGPMRSEDLLALAKTKQGTHSLLMKEAVLGGGGVKNLEDYVEKRDYIYKQLADPKQQDNYSHFRQALFDLNRLAKQAGIKIEESRAHKQLATWFKNRELADKFARGELNIPTPQERRAELEKQKAAEKKPVKEYSTMPNQTASSANTAISTTATSSDPNAKAQAAKVAQATTAIKAATGTPTSTTLLAKGLNAATQGKAVSAQDMKAIEPVMDVIGQAAQDPKLANQFKTLAQQARVEQQKQVALQKTAK